MAEASIERINIEISADSSKAAKSLEKLMGTLQKLQSYADKISGVTSNLMKLSQGIKSLSGIKAINLNGATKSIEKLAAMTKEFNTMGNIDTSKVKSLSSLSNVVKAFSDTPSNKMSIWLKNAKQLPEAVQLLNNLPAVEESKIKQIAQAFEPFKSLSGKTGTGFINTISKLPNIAKILNSMDMTKFAQGIRSVSSALEPLAVQAERIKGMFNHMPSVISRAITSNQNFSASNNSVTKSFGSLSGKITIAIGKITAMYYGLSRVVNAFKECFNESSEYIENINLFRVTMGDASDEALRYADSVSEALGIDTSQFVRYQGIFNRMTNGFGTGAEKSRLMSKNLVQLGYDMSSMFNTDIETAMEKLESAMAGQIKGVKEYGYDLSVAALQETALKHGITEKVSVMSQAEKAQLRYITLMEHSNEVLGDMARTIDTPANAMRILEQQWVQLKRAIGNVISMVVVKLLPYIQAFVKLVTEGVNKLAEMWGFELPEIDYSSLTSGANALDETEEGLTDVSEAAAKTAKKISSLAGFDELNILSFNNDTETDSTSNTDKAKTMDLGIELPEYDFLEGLDSQSDKIYRKMKDALGKVVEKLKDLWGWIKKNKDFLEKLGIVLAGLWGISKIKKFISFAAGLFSPFKKVFDLIKQTSAFTKLSGWFKSVSGEGTALGKVLGVVKSVIAGIVGGIVAFASFNDLFYDLRKGTLDWKTGLLDVTLGIGGIAAAFAFGGPIAGIAAIIGGVVGAIKGWIDAEYDLRIEMAQNKWLYNGEGNVSLDELKDSFTAFADQITKDSDKFIDLGEDIDAAFDKTSDARDKVENLMSKFGSAREQITKTDCTELKKAIDELASASKNQLEIVMKGAVDSVQSSFTNLKENAVGVKDEIIAAFYLVGAQGNEMLADAQKKANQLVDELSNTKLTQKEYDSKYSELVKQVEIMGDFSLTGDTSVEDFNVMMSKFKDKAYTLKIEDQESVEKFWKDIEEEYNGAVDKLDQAYRAQVTSINQLRKMNSQLLKQGKGVSDELFTQALDNANMNFESKKNKLQDAIGEMSDIFADKINETGVMAYLARSESLFEESSLTWLRSYKESVDNGSKTMEEAMKLLRDNCFSSDAWSDSTKPAIDTIKTSFSNMDMDLAKSFAKTPDRLVTALNTYGDLYKLDKSGGSCGYKFITAFDDAFQASAGTFKKIPSDISQDLQEGWKGLPDSAKQLTVNIGYDSDTNTFNEILNSLTTTIQQRLNNIVNSSTKAVDFGIQYLQYGLSGKKGSAPTIPKFATGGFPNYGEMFIAREAGPEMVGRIGSRTAVANNDQITSAIAQAVESAILRTGAFAVQGGSSDAGDTYVFIDSEEIAARLERRSASRNIRTNGRG